MHLPVGTAGERAVLINLLKGGDACNLWFVGYPNTRATCAHAHRNGKKHGSGVRTFTDGRPSQQGLWQKNRFVLSMSLEEMTTRPSLCSDSAASVGLITLSIGDTAPSTATPEGARTCIHTSGTGPAQAQLLFTLAVAEESNHAPRSRKTLPHVPVTHTPQHQHTPCPSTTPHTPHTLHNASHHAVRKVRKSLPTVPS